MEKLRFKLWLEWEHVNFSPWNPTDDFANVSVRLADGRKYAMNVWTFKFVHRARFPWPYDDVSGEPSKYVLTPDLIVERLDRPTLKAVIKELLMKDEMRKEWLCPPDKDGT